MKSKFILASAAILGLAACGGEPAEEPTQEAAAETTDCPPGISVSNGWMAMGAVEGNPAAVYFTIENGSERNYMIRAADVLGFGSAMLHQMGEMNMQPSMDEMLQLDVPVGETVVFEPETMHVMAMAPDGTQEVGGETEVTLTFVGGDKCSFPVEIRAPGDAPE